MSSRVVALHRRPLKRGGQKGNTVTNAFWGDPQCSPLANPVSVAWASVKQRWPPGGMPVQSRKGHQAAVCRAGTICLKDAPGVWRWHKPSH